MPDFREDNTGKPMAHHSSNSEAVPLALMPADMSLADQLDALARQYRGALLRFFSKRMSNSADAEDLTQEVFIRIACTHGTTDIQNMEAYLFQTASNLLRDRARRDAVRHVHDHMSLEDAGYEGESPSEERVYEGKEAIETFLTTLSTMPPRRKMCFLMHRFMGLSYAAIALRLGISVSVVEKHMTKALLDFHETLGPL